MVTELEKYIFLLTLKHSGTHYAMSVLNQLHIQQGCYNKGNMKVNGWPGAYIHLHLCEPSNNALTGPRGDKIIVCLRNPIDIYKSWVKRRFDNADNGIRNAFQLFDQAMAKFNPHVFRVDGNEETEVDELANFLGVKRLPVSVPESDRNTYTRYTFDGVVPKFVYERATQYGY